MTTTDRDVEMASRFTRGLRPEDVADFAEEHGYGARPVAGRAAGSERRPVEGYVAQAVCRGGGKLLSRQEGVEGAPWIVSLPVSGGGVALWELDELPAARGGRGTALVLGAGAVLLLALACALVGALGWPW